MIKNSSDLKYYISQDVKNNKFENSFVSYFFNDIRVYLRRLRQLEYILNTKHGLLWKFVKQFCRYRFKKLSKKLGFSIPPNVAGPGLMLPHYGNIVINKKVKIGSNCKLHVGINIGADFRDGNKTPKIGNDCYIAPGAKLYGNIVIADHSIIGANAVVNKSFEQSGSVIVGIPAKCIRQRDDVSE